MYVFIYVVLVCVCVSVYLVLTLNLSNTHFSLCSRAVLSALVQCVCCDCAEESFSSVGVLQTWNLSFLHKSGECVWKNKNINHIHMQLSMWPQILQKWLFCKSADNAGKPWKNTFHLWCWPYTRMQSVTEEKFPVMSLTKTYGSEKTMVQTSPH